MYPTELGLGFRTILSNAAPSESSVKTLNRAFSRTQSVAVGPELHIGWAVQFAGTLAMAAEAEGEAPVGLEDANLAGAHVGDDNPPPFVGHDVADRGEQVGVVAVDLADLKLDLALVDGNVGLGARIGPFVSSGARSRQQNRHCRPRPAERTVERHERRGKLGGADRT